MGACGLVRGARNDAARVPPPRSMRSRDPKNYARPPAEADAKDSSEESPAPRATTRASRHQPAARATPNQKPTDPTTKPNARHQSGRSTAGARKRAKARREGPAERTRQRARDRETRATRSQQRQPKPRQPPHEGSRQSKRGKAQGARNTSSPRQAGRKTARAENEEAKTPPKEEPKTSHRKHPTKATPPDHRAAGGKAGKNEPKRDVQPGRDGKRGKKKNQEAGGGGRARCFPVVSAGVARDVLRRLRRSGHRSRPPPPRFLVFFFSPLSVAPAEHPFLAHFLPASSPRFACGPVVGRRGFCGVLPVARFRFLLRWRLGLLVFRARRFSARLAW